MTRPGAVRAAVAVLALPVLVATPSSAQEGPSRPDIVLVVTDDQRWDTWFAMPIASAEIVEGGATFPEAFVVNPLCCPSRASILTGDYSHTHLVYRQAPPFGRFEWFDDRSTLATWLHDGGYRTGLFGKYLDGYQHAAVTGYVPPGWDRWVAFVHAAPYDYGLTFDGVVRSYGHGPNEHSTEVLADEAVAFIRSAGEGPLFLEFAPSSPHAPATPTPRDDDAFALLRPDHPSSFDEADVSDKPAWVRALPPLSRAEEGVIDAFARDQARALLGVDRAIGRILDALAAGGRLENTLFIVTSDNGILHGEHRWTKKEAPYEEAIRVPLALRWDAAGWDVPVTRPGDLALNIDLAPTIADAAGVSHPAMDGRSLLPLLDGTVTAWRSDFLVEHMEGTNRVPTYCAVRSDRWMYVRYATGEEELYDLRADPFELDNLASEPSVADVLDGRRARLRELCSPPPPGYEDRASSALPLALAALVAIVLLEIAAARRSASSIAPPVR